MRVRNIKSLLVHRNVNFDILVLKNLGNGRMKFISDKTKKPFTWCPLFIAPQ